MKFHNGGWMPKKNHGIFSPGRVFETERKGNVLTVDVVNEKPCTVRLVNTNKVSLSAKETQSDDVEMQQDGADCVLMIKSGGGHISVRME